MRRGREARAAAPGTMNKVTDGATAPAPARVGFLTEPPHWEPSPKWVRVWFAGVIIADSKRAMLLWEPPRPTPTYYFPLDDVRTDMLQPSDHTRPSQAMGEATYWNVVAGSRRADQAAWTYRKPPNGAPQLSSHVAFKWDMMDAWFEEDDEAFVHPRDPHHRIDVLNSSRHVRVEVEGVTVAESTRPRLLFETALLVRYYIPKLDVRMELLRPSNTVTRCPYKGSANHWDFENGGTHVADVAWTYHLPAPEVATIADLVAFYNERVDAIYVDGELQPAPATPWSRTR